jgi:hypothetical protein
VLDPLVVTAVSVGFGLLLLLGAVHKLTGIAAFRAILADYRIMPAGLVAPVAIGVGVMEAGLGAAWLIAADKSVPAIATVALLLVYATGIGVNLLRGRTHISCGCSFGRAAGGDDLLSWGLVGRNLVLAACAATAMLPATARAFGGLDYFTLVTALAAAVLLFAASNQLIRNRAAIQAWRRTVTRDD